MNVEIIKRESDNLYQWDMIREDGEVFPVSFAHRSGGKWSAWSVSGPGCDNVELIESRQRGPSYRVARAVAVTLGYTGK